MKTAKEWLVDDYIESKLFHEIHNSERKSFEGCRRRWDWHFRDSLYPPTTLKVFEFGIAYHKGMEVYYNPETWKWDDEVKANLSIKAFVDSCEEQRAKALASNIFYDHEVEQDYNERVELGKGMLNYYFSSVAPKEDNWIPVKAEIAFIVPIKNPDTGEEVMWCKCNTCIEKYEKFANKDPDSDIEISIVNGKISMNGQGHMPWKGLPVVYAGRIDLIVQDKFGNLHILDWKTAKNVTAEENTEFLDLDGQIACVPMDTEALTPTGWKTRNQLQVGDIILAYDTMSESNKWTPILDIYDYDNANLIELSSNDGSFVTITTPNHRWIGEKPSTYRDILGNPYGTIVDWEPLTSEISSKRGAIYVSANSEINGTLDITPDEAAFISWILTDGSIRTVGNYHQAQISQSWHKYADEIENLINRLGLYKHTVESQSELGKDHNPYTIFTFSSPEIRSLWTKAKLDGSNKSKGLDQFILGLSDKARFAFCDAGMKAEGSRQQVFHQNDGPIKEAYRLAFFLENSRISIGNNKNFNVNKSRPIVDTRTIISNKLEGTYRVWCVSTKYGSWVMRQGKQITITGNSYMWALRKLGIKIQSFIYHEQRKGYPQKPKENMHIRKGCKFSVAKNQEVDFETYLKTITREDTDAWAEGNYDDFLQYLREEGIVYYSRRQVIKTPDQDEETEFNIGQEALDMIDPKVRIYPMPSRFGCKNCAFIVPCVEKNSKGDYQYALDTLFERREHYYVRQAEGPSTESNRND